ncbi:MAG: RidA family protein [Methylophilales bacterium]|jgi:reactive intermediate/imine deaminase|nr:Rid family detoxifying hydrolase [Pseudomonadota bacterium]NQW35249.1 RidA family protein [Methylophilales bacterium]HCK03454.1 reactive intermediate/imine deaminase [Methylophilaceae bacterium]|tara:strand:+ start:5642 stop:6022 length:381 start_codon:yes stop_codon:yes gene_type:complete
MTKTVIKTTKAPSAIGTYSQAIKKNNIIFLSGQIGLDPTSMILVEGIEAQIHQVFKNLIEVIKASNATTDDLVKLNIYLTDLNHFSMVNEIMTSYFNEPYPARAAVGVLSLPKGALIEADGFVVED